MACSEGWLWRACSDECTCMQHACGYEYTARLQRMVVDIRLSADAMTEFQENLARHEESLPISFSTMVLQSAAWPLQKSACPVFIPPQLLLAKSKVSDLGLELAARVSG